MSSQDGGISPAGVNNPPPLPARGKGAPVKERAINDKKVVVVDPVKVVSDRPSKGWSITAIVVGALILGVGVCGGLGLLNIYGRLPLPTGLETFIGHIGYTGLWGMTAAAGVFAGILLGGGIDKYCEYRNHPITRQERNLERFNAKFPQNDKVEKESKCDDELDVVRVIHGVDEDFLNCPKKHSNRKIPKDKVKGLRTELTLSDKVKRTLDVRMAEGERKKERSAELNKIAAVVKAKRIKKATKQAEATRLAEEAAKQAEATRLAAEAAKQAEDARIDGMFSEGNFEKIGVIPSNFKLTGSKPFISLMKDGKDYYVRLKDGLKECTPLLDKDGSDSKAVDAYLKSKK